MFRREWRQQALILVLLTTAVAAAIAGAAAVYNTAGVAETAEFGRARTILAWDEVAPGGLAADLAAADDHVGAGNAELLTRWQRPAPGAVERIEYRAQDPAGALSAPTLALRDGHYPTAVDETALTDGTAELLQLDVGDVLSLDGVDRTVVGLVENPGDLGDEFALVSPLAGTGSDLPTSASLLLRGDESAVHGLMTSGQFADRTLDLRTRGPDPGPLAAATIVGAMAVVLVLVALLSTAGFVVLAQRRQRQFGMLSAVGAAEKLLRLATLAHGMAVGLVAATVGVTLGLGGWLLAAPRMEAAVDHRIDTFHLPWALLVLAAVMAVAAATAAAWLPARAVSRTPVTEALSGRPPTPRPAHHSTLLAGGFLVVGTTCLVASTSRSTLLVLVGTVTAVVGVLLASPLALRALAATSRWLPIGFRLSFRDLGRYQARSGAALAAITLVVGIPVAVVVTAAASEHTAEEGNLSDRELLIWTRSADDPVGYSPFYTEDPNDSGFAPFLPDLSAAEIAERGRQANRIGEALGDAKVIPLDVVVDPRMEASEFGKPSVALARHMDEDDSWLDIALVFVATPELLDRYGPVLSTADADVDAYTTERGPVAFTNTLDPESGDFRAQAVGAPVRLERRYSSLPGTFVTPAGLDRRGWETTRVGWLVEADHALDADERAQARGIAAGTDLLVEGRTEQPSLRDLRMWATGIAAALALGVVAATVGLIRSDSAGDLRTLTATGASTRLRRTLTATTAGGLALLGVVLGTAGAYLALATGYHEQLGDLSPAPVGHLLLMVLGIPALAAAAGWLVARPVAE